MLVTMALLRLLCVTLWAQAAGFAARSGLPRRARAVARRALPPGLAPPSAEDVANFALREVERGDDLLLARHVGRAEGGVGAQLGRDGLAR